MNLRWVEEKNIFLPYSAIYIFPRKIVFHQSTQNIVFIFLFGFLCLDDLITKCPLGYEVPKKYVLQIELSNILIYLVSFKSLVFLKFSHQVEIQLLIP